MDSHPKDRKSSCSSSHNRISSPLAVDSKQAAQICSESDICGEDSRRIFKLRPLNKVVSGSATLATGSNTAIVQQSSGNPESRLTVVLDLDETLIHSSFVSVERADMVLDLGSPCYVQYRPGLVDFLEFASDFFELILFTAAEQTYADSVLNKLDQKRELIKVRYYRESCSVVSQTLVKDLDILGRDLKRVVFVDNSPAAFCLQPNNGIPIKSWTGGREDNELFSLYRLLKRLDLVKDVRPYLSKLFNVSPSRIL